MELTAVGVAFAATAMAACAKSAAPPAPEQAPAAAVTAVTVDAAPATPDATPTPPEPIGVATMQADGTIVMDLRATGPGVMGDARITYPKDHKDYQMVLDHLDGLAPGETKPVPPFP